MKIFAVFLLYKTELSLFSWSLLKSVTLVLGRQPSIKLKKSHEVKRTAGLTGNLFGIFFCEDDTVQPSNAPVGFQSLLAS